MGEIDTDQMRRRARMTNLHKEADMLAMADEIDRLRHRLSNAELLCSFACENACGDCSGCITAGNHFEAEDSSQ